MPGAQQDQKKVSDPLGSAVKSSCELAHVNFGDQIQVLCRISACTIEPLPAFLSVKDLSEDKMLLNGVGNVSVQFGYTSGASS